MNALFSGWLNRESFFEVCHQLWWQQYGGSGYSLSRDSIMEMDLDELHWHVKRVQQARRDERDALERAYRKG